MKQVLCAPAMHANPYQDLLARALEPLGYHLRLEPLTWRTGRRLRPDDALLHLHWLAPLFADPRRARTAVKTALLEHSLKRLTRNGVPLVWTVHNLYEHERRHTGLERRLRLWLARNAALIVHGHAAAEIVRSEYGVPEHREIAVVPHGNYVDVYPVRHTRSEAREMLGLEPEAPTLLFLGSISPYKGVLPLVDALASVGAGLQLVVAGQASPRRLEEELQARARRVPGLRLRLGFVPDEEVSVLGAASDLIVLPHSEVADDPDLEENPRIEILTSGSAVLAMSLGRACIAPRMRCFEELLGEGGAFLFDPALPGSLESALRTALAERERWDEMGQRNLRAAEPCNWGRVAEQTAHVYSSALRHSRPS